jgi:hypothetical protein
MLVLVVPVVAVVRAQLPALEPLAKDLMVEMVPQPELVTAVAVAVLVKPAELLTLVPVSVEKGEMAFKMRLRAQAFTTLAAAPAEEVQLLAVLAVAVILA